MTKIDTVLNKGINKLAEEFEKLLLLCNPYIKIIYKNGNYIQAISLESQAIQSNMKNYEEIIKHMIDVMDSNNIKVHYLIYEKVRSENIKTQLKANVTENIKTWEDMDQEIPYERGTHPFELYFNLLYEIVNYDIKMWEKIFTYTPDSIKACVNICNSINIDLDSVLSPIWEEIDIKDMKVKKANVILKQINTFLIRLDAFDVLTKRFDELQDFFKPDSQKESIASAALTKIRDSLLEACVESIVILTNSMSYDGSISYAINKDKKSTEDGDWICDLHPITGNVLHCCKQMAKFKIYKQVISMAIEEDINTPSPLPEQTEFINIMLGKLLVGIQLMASKFSSKSIEDSLLSRELHVKSHKLYEVGSKEAEELLSTARKHLFMVNNSYSILTYLREKRKELQVQMSKSVNNPNPNIHEQKLLHFLDTIETKFNEEKTNFCEKVNFVLGMNEEDMKEFNNRYIKDKPGQYRLLKAKFSMFNSGMDAFLAQQGEWRVSSSDLRQHLGELLIETIVPPYMEFFSTYSVIPFSKKHMSGYLKYQPKIIEDKLKTYFGKQIT